MGMHVMIEVYIDNPPYRDIACIYIIERKDQESYIWNNEDNVWLMRPIEHGTIVNKASMEIPYWMADEVFKGIVDAISKKGIMPNASSVLEGEMKATKIHLEDMRRLVFK